MTGLPTRDQTPQIAGEPGARRGPGRAASSARGGVSGHDVIRILRRRKWLLGLSIVIGGAIAFVSTLLWSRYAPIYTASAIIGVNPPSTSPLTGTEQLYGAADMERIKNSHVQLVKRLSVLQRAAETEKLRNTAWFRQDPPNVVSRLMKKIDVRSVRQTSHIRISMTGAASRPRDRTDLAEIATAVAEAFVTEARQAATQDRFETIQGLDDERKGLARKLEAARAEMETIRKTSVDVLDMQEQQGTLNATLTALNRQRTELELTRDQAQSDLAIIRELGDAERACLAPVVAALQQDPHLPVLRSTEVSYANELDSASRKFGQRHRTVREYTARLANLRATIAQKEKEVIDGTVGRMIERYKNQKRAAEARLVEVGERIKETKRQIRAVQAELARLAQLSARETGLVQNITRIENRLLELRLQRRREQPVYLAGAAEIPDEPSMPKWSIMMPLGVLLGLSLGMGLTFLLEFMDTSIQTPSDITRRVDLPLLGMVPHTADVEDEAEDLRAAFRGPPGSLISESFRQIRTSLLFSGPIERRRSVLVTSALPRDGRTAVTVNLAAAMARGGRKVLVVDANFRQPAMRGLFAPDQDGGLSNALTGQAHWRDLVREVEPGLSVLPAGPLPPNPAELLGSRQMRDLIRQMLEPYDQVLFDGAPCLVVTDACILATQVDSVILVARAGVNTYGIVQRARDLLSRVGAHFLGAVLNGVRVTAGGYLRKNYETFYQYGGQPPTPAGS